MDRMSSTLRWLLCTLLLAAGLSACRQADTPATQEPAAALRAQAQALRDNDLARYAELSLPPTLRQQTAQLWERRMREAAGVDDGNRERFEQAMQRLTAKDADTALYHLYEQRIARVEKEIAGQWPMLQATADIFLKAAIEANDELDSAEKSHATHAIAALLAWLQPSLITDRDKARQAIKVVTATARALDLKTLDQTRALAWQPALEKGGIALGGLKQLGKIYGVDADAAIDRMQVKVISADARQAMLEVRYPLFGQNLAFELAMVHEEGGWYRANAVRQARAEWAEAEQAVPAAATTRDAVAPVTPGDAADALEH